MQYEINHVLTRSGYDCVTVWSKLL